MKKFLILFWFFSLGLSASADVFFIETDVNMKNYWEKNGKDEQKVLEVAERIINANKLDKHIAVYVLRKPSYRNAYAQYSDKTVTVSTGILPYFDNDDELAYVLGHEMGHCLDYYKGPTSLVNITFNRKAFEKRADLSGIDLMARAGYNPVAAITVQKKISGEHVWDTWIFFSHPKASTRMMDMYKYIYKNYPESLNSAMIKDVNYQNFVYSSKKEINSFHQKEKLRQLKVQEGL